MVTNQDQSTIDEFVKLTGGGAETEINDLARTFGAVVDPEEIARRMSGAIVQASDVEVVGRGYTDEVFLGPWKF